MAIIVSILAIATISAGVGGIIAYKEFAINKSTNSPNFITISYQPAIETYAYNLVGGLAFKNYYSVTYPNGTSYYGLYTNLDFNYTVNPPTANFDYHNLNVYSNATANGQPAIILNKSSTPITGTDLNLMDFTLVGNITNYSLHYNGTDKVTICQVG